MKKIALAVIILLTAVLGTNAITSALSDVVQIKLRQHTFLIPKRFAMSGRSVMPDWLLNMSGLDDGSNSALFRIDDQEIKANVTGYRTDNENQFRDDIKGLLSALTPRELSDYHHPETFAQLGDMWRGTGSYKNRKIEPAEMPGWYKVYRAIEYPESWMLVKEFPDSAKPVPDQVSHFWVADCLMLGPKGKRIGSCNTYLYIGDIQVEFSLSEYNLPVLDEVRNFIRAQVLEWKH